MADSAWLAVPSAITFMGSSPTSMAATHSMDTKRLSVFFIFQASPFLGNIVSKMAVFFRMQNRRIYFNINIIRHIILFVKRKNAKTIVFIAFSLHIPRLNFVYFIQFLDILQTFQYLIIDIKDL